jgi:hypothetical protein
MALPTLYLESSIPSYLVGRDPRDILTTANRKLTREWWGTQRTQYTLFISTAVRDEISKGDPVLAAERLRTVANLPILEETPAATELSGKLLRDGALPPVAIVDATHVAICAIYSIEYLVTWNCHHINNAHLRRKIERACAAFHFPCPIICSPRQLLAL